MDSDSSDHLQKALVSEAVTRYFHALDAFDADGVRGVLADEFTLDAGTLVERQPEPRPLDDFMEELVARNWGFESTLHLHPNHLVEVAGDTAHVAAGMWASHIAGPRAEELFWAYGLYSIHLTRGDSGWKMSRLEIKTLRTEGGEPGRVYEIAAERHRAGEGHPAS